MGAICPSFSFLSVCSYGQLQLGGSSALPRVHFLGCSQRRPIRTMSVLYACPVSPARQEECSSRVDRLGKSRPANAEVCETRRGHGGRIVQIPAVNHDGIAQRIVKPVEIEFGKFLPIVKNQQSICLLRRGIR